MFHIYNESKYLIKYACFDVKKILIHQVSFFLFAQLVSFTMTVRERLTRFLREFRRENEFVGDSCRHQCTTCCCNPNECVNHIETQSQPTSTQQDSLIFHLFDRKEKTMRQLSKESASFMWSQFLIDVLKKFPVDKDT